MVRAIIAGVEEESTRASGLTIRPMAKAFSSGQMAVLMKESTGMIEKVVMEFSDGPMAVFMKATGMMASSMGKAHTQLHKVRVAAVSGPMAIEYAGYLRLS